MGSASDRRLPAVREGQRYALISATGEEVNDWQVIHTCVMPDGRLRATIFSVDAPADTMDVYGEELMNTRLFRLVQDVPTLARPTHLRVIRLPE